MRTPREILLDQQRHAIPNLDRVRTECVRQIARSRKRSILQKLHSELILPYRRLWSGLGAAWLFIIVAQVATGPADDPEAARTHAASRNSPLDSAQAALLAEQRRLRDELLGIEMAETKPAESETEPGRRSSVIARTAVC